MSNVYDAETQALIEKFESLPADKAGVLSIVGTLGSHSIENGALWGFLTREDIRDNILIKSALKDSNLTMYWKSGKSEDAKASSYIVLVEPYTYASGLRELGSADSKTIEAMLDRSAKLKEKSYDALLKRLNKFYLEEYPKGVQYLNIGIFSSNASHKATNSDNVVIDSYQIDLHTLSAVLGEFTENTGIPVQYTLDKNLAVVFDGSTPEVRSYLGDVDYCKGNNAIQVRLAFGVL